jgi:hypothetical protein
MRDIADMDESVYDDNCWSSCCGASVWSETDICSDCKEHCDLECEDDEKTNDTNLKFKYQ